MEVFNDGHLVPGASRGPEFEPNDLPLLRQFDFVDLVERLDAALHLGGLGGVRLEPLNEPLLFRQHGLLAAKGGLLIRLADRPFPLVVVVVARVDRDLTVVYFSDLRDDAVHEFAIVRRHHQRACS